MCMALLEVRNALNKCLSNLCVDAGDETHDADSGDLNKLLFSAIVQSN